MIRVEIDVSDAGGERWEVRISSRDLSISIVRFVTRLGGPAGAYPVVPPDDLPAGLPAAARELATASDDAAIADVRLRLATGQPQAADIATFGAYLHAVLFGRCWPEIAAAAAGQPLEFALRWPVTQWQLARLPWELVYAPDQESGRWKALARHSVITRLIPGPASCDARKLTISPKVLFVVGAEIDDPAIRPGAEFFSIWERLQQQDVYFDFRVLLRPSSQQIEAELTSFEPSVVHFICHGDDADGGGRLKLVSKDAHGRLTPDSRSAGHFLDLLEGTKGYPPVVVLSACYSGATGSASARVDAPLAAQLVDGGVPVVVGMGGRVSDQACRLFAEQFYQALLSGQPITEATALGRRAGLKHGADPDQTIDWALPMLFIADGVDPVLDVDSGEVARVRQRARWAKTLRASPQNPIAFCGRTEAMEALRALLDEHTGTQVLVLHETDWMSGKGDKFGMTRVLRELAARSVLDGHVPVLLTFPPGDARPTTANDLLRELSNAVLDAVPFTGAMAGFDSELARLYQLVKVPGSTQVADLPVAIKPLYENWRASGDLQVAAKMIKEALRADLKKLLALGRATLGSESLRAIVLLDDLHEFDAAARTFLDLIDAEGLGDDDEPVPVVFTFSSQSDREFDSTISLLRAFVENKGQGRYLKCVELERFRSPKDPNPFAGDDSVWSDPLALIYRQYLFNLDPGIVLHAHAPTADLKWFLDEVHRLVLGVPSRLRVPEQPGPVQVVIDVLLGLQAVRKKSMVPIIEQIDDELALSESSLP